MTAAAAAAGVAALVMALAGTGGTGATGVRSAHAELASSTVGARATILPLDCRPSLPGPPGAPYELGLVLQIGHPPGTDPTVANGTITAGATSVTGIAASVCGVVKVVPGPPSCPAQGTVTIPVDGQVFAPLTAVLSLVPGQPIAVPFKVVPNPITATLACTSSVNGLVTTSVADLAGSTGLFSVSCVVGPARATLSAILTSPSSSFTDLRGTLSGPVSLPTATVSPTCPLAVATNLDQLASLPLTGQITLPVKAALYQPGGAP